MAVEVAAGVLCNTQGQVLVSQRHIDAHLPGTWEFPGGKLEADESPQQALARELNEELGIEVLAAQPLITITHQYPEKTVRLHIFDVLRWQGEPQGREQQLLQWVDDSKLQQLDMPAADLPILKALRLPGQYLITPPVGDRQQWFIEQLRQSLVSGIGVVQLRQPDMPTEKLLELARLCQPICSQAGARLVINGATDLIDQYPGDGLHLNSNQLARLAAKPNMRANVRALLKPGQLLGASCHDAEELRLAHELDCDYALLSPVKPTRSHPQAKILGWTCFRKLAINSNLPVYALGGMQPHDQDQARANGAVGVAGISGFWKQ